MFTGKASESYRQRDSVSFGPVWTPRIRDERPLGDVPKQPVRSTIKQAQLVTSVSLFRRLRSSDNDPTHNRWILSPSSAVSSEGDKMVDFGMTWLKSIGFFCVLVTSWGASASTASSCPCSSTCSSI